jgi:hypothetical protein
MPTLEVSSVEVAECKSNTKDNARLMQALSKLWKQYDRRGLEVRHQTGAALNTHLGPPSKRQRYGVTVLKKVAGELKLSVSDLSRMRRFASLFTSTAELKTQHPGVSTWTEVKTLIVGLGSATEKPASTGDNQQKSQAKRSLRDLIRALEAAQKHAAGVGKLTPDGDDWTTLSKKLRDAVAAVETNNLGVRYCPTMPLLGIDAKIPLIGPMENDFVITHETNTPLGQVTVNA